ncbi:unnamed protein product, partial [marine sediment metagenome]
KPVHRLAVNHDRLICIAVTSRSRGKYANEGLPFGEGKSTLAYHISKAVYQKYGSFGPEKAGQLARENYGYTWEDMDRMFERANDSRVLSYVADDFQAIAGKDVAHDPEVKRKASHLTTARPFLAVFISTQPDLSYIAKCWRDVFIIEIKIPFRGFCEIHMLDTYSPFRDPLNPRVRLAYKTEMNFPDLDEEEKAWYVPWRKNKTHTQKRDIYNKPEKGKRGRPIDESVGLLREFGVVGPQAHLRKIVKALR